MCGEYQRWECSCFCRKFGFLMVPKVILEICLNLMRKIICVYALPNHKLLTLCAPAAIMSAILYRFSFFCVALEAYHWKWPIVVRIREFCGGLQVARLW